MPSPKQFARYPGRTAAFQSSEPASEAVFDLVSARYCDSAIALHTTQFGDGVGGQFGGALWLLCTVLIVDCKLFRSFDSGFERLLRVFQSCGRFLALGR